MSSLMKSLSDTEIRDYTEQGKGWDPLTCSYYLYLCTIGIGNGGLDSGTCSYIYSQCGYTPGGGGGCGTCTCH